MLQMQCLLSSPHPNSYVATLTPNMMVFGSEAFGEWLSHERRASMNGISVLIKETLESSLSPLRPCKDTARMSICNAEKHSSQNPTMLESWFGLPACRTRRNKFLLFISHSVWGTLFSGLNGLIQLRMEEAFLSEHCHSECSLPSPKSLFRNLDFWHQSKPEPIF